MDVHTHQNGETTMKTTFTSLTFAMLALAMSAQVMAHEGEVEEAAEAQAQAQAKAGLRYGDSASIGNGRYTAYTKVAKNGKP